MLQGRFVGDPGKAWLKILEYYYFTCNCNTSQHTFSGLGLWNGICWGNHETLIKDANLYS